VFRGHDKREKRSERKAETENREKIWLPLHIASAIIYVVFCEVAFMPIKNATGNAAGATAETVRPRLHRLMRQNERDRRFHT
jgi:hypothetical protein